MSNLSGMTAQELENVASQVEHWLTVRQNAAAERDKYAAAVEEASTQIKALLAVLGIKRYESVAYVANFIEQKRESISKTKLAAKGVPVAVITECTEINTVEQLRVTKKTTPSSMEP